MENHGLAKTNHLGYFLSTVYWDGKLGDRKILFVSIVYQWCVQNIKCMKN